MPSKLVDAEISDFAIRLYAWMEQRATKGTIEAGVRSLSQQLNRHYTTVIRALQELINLGAVLPTRRGTAVDPKPSRYVVLTDWEEADATIQLSLDAGIPGASAHQGAGASAHQGLVRQRNSSTDPSTPPSYNPPVSLPSSSSLRSLLSGGMLPGMDPPVPREDLVWEAFLAATNVAQEELTPARRKALNGMVAAIKQVNHTPDLPGEVIRRAERWYRQWPGIPLTPETFVRRWAELGSRAGSALRQAQQRTTPQQQQAPPHEPVSPEALRAVMRTQAANGNGFARRYLVAHGETVPPLEQAGTDPGGMV